MSDETYKHGSMPITTQEQTFEGFIKMVSRVSILCIVVLIFLALVNG